MRTRESLAKWTTIFSTTALTLLGLVSLLSDDKFMRPALSSVLVATNLLAGFAFGRKLSAEKKLYEENDSGVTTPEGKNERV